MHTTQRRRRSAKPLRTRRLWLEGLEERIALNSAAIWINPDGGDWFDPRNWQTSTGSSLPGPNDDVIIDQLKPGATVRYFSTIFPSPPTTPSVHSITSMAPFLMLGGALDIADVSDFKDLFVAGGNLSGSGDIEVTGQFVWAGGTLSGSGDLFSKGTLTISGGSTTSAGSTGTVDVTRGTQPMPIGNAPLVLDGRHLFNFGRADFSGGDVLQRNQSAFINTGRGVFTYGSDGDFGPLFRNFGVFIKGGVTTTTSKTSASTTFTSSHAGAAGGTTSPVANMSIFVNNGQVFLKSGMLHVFAYAQGGGSTMLTGGGLAADNPIQIGDGVVGGGGVISGDVANNGGTFIPGSAAGPLVINGNYFQGDTGDLVVHLDGSGAPHFMVKGTANLDGNLVINYAPGFVPSAGQTFVVMLYGAGVGEFAGLVGANPSAEISLVASYDANDVTLVAQASDQVIDDLLEDTAVADPGVPLPPSPANDLLDSLALQAIPPGSQVPIGSLGTIQAAGHSGAGHINSAGVVTSPLFAIRLPKATGSDKVGDELVETALDKLQTVFDDVDLPIAADALTGADIAGALLTGARPRANLLPQKGARVAPVATLLSGDAPDQPAADAAKPGDDRLRDSLISPLQNDTPTRPAAGQRSEGPEDEAHPLALPIAGALLAGGMLNTEKKRR